MRYFILVLLALCLASCVTPKLSVKPKPKLREGRIELTGVAGNLADHSEKANCQGITFHGKEILFKGDFKAIPKDVVGKKIKVTGILKKKNLPMFISRQKKGSVGRPPQGIPMPPGTNSKKESVYYVIQDPKWEIVK